MENLKRWQWILIGLILGLVFSASRIFLGPALDKDHPNRLVRAETDQERKYVLEGRASYARRHQYWAIQPNFEEDILRPPGNLPYFQNIVVHPKDPSDPKDQTWITLSAFTVKPPVAGAKTAPPPASQEAAAPLPRLQREFCYPVAVPYLPQPNYLIEDPPKTFGLTPDPKYVQSRADAYTQDAQAHRDLDQVSKEIRALSASHAPDKSAQLSELHQRQIALQKKVDEVHPELTIAFYLQELKAKYPKSTFNYRYAREEEPRVILAMYTTAMVILVGGIWPTLLRLLGYGPKPGAQGSDLKWIPAKTSAKNPQTGMEMTAQDLSRLGALEQEMERKLKAGGEPLVAVSVGPAPNQGGNTAPPPVKQLSGIAARPKSEAAAKAEEKKDFGASHEDFYPTEVHAPAPKEP